MRAQRELGASIVDLVDVDALRDEVRKKYRDVAASPTAEFHFHTGLAHALRMGYPASPLDQLPEEASRGFRRRREPFLLGTAPRRRECRRSRVRDRHGLVHCGSLSLGRSGRVIGVDMTTEMVDRARNLARQLGLDNVEFRLGLIEKLPIEDGWADVVISNGVINLCPDKLGVYREVYRVLKPGGRMTIADICVEKPVPEGALKDIDLWTG